MRKYIEHIKNTRTPHERRQIALQLSGVMTALLVVGWVASIGVRLNYHDAAVANAQNSSQTASVADFSVQEAPNMLEVATTSQYGQ